MDFCISYRILFQLFPSSKVMSRGEKFRHFWWGFWVGAIVSIFNTHFKEYSTRGDTYFPKSRLTRSRVHRYLGFVLRVGKLF